MDESIVLESEVNSFLNGLQAIGRGDLVQEAAKRMKQCVKATMLEEKKSTLTIKIEINRVKESDDPQVMLSGSVAYTAPKPTVKANYFVNEHTFELSRNRPEQTILPNMAK